MFGEMPAPSMLRYHTAEVLALAEAGWTNSDIGEKFNCSRQTVRGFLNQRGASFRTGCPMETADPEDIRRYKAAAMSDEAIAKLYKVTPGRVFTFRLRHDIGGVHDRAKRANSEQSERSRGIAAAVVGLAKLCTDRGREAALYAGQRYDDSPKACRPEPKLRPVSVDWMHGGRSL